MAKRVPIYLAAFFMIFFVICTEKGLAIQLSRAKIAISLGTDGILAKLGDSRFSPTDEYALVQPGVVLILFDNEHHYRGRTLALSSTGIWMYVPTDPSNLISEATIFDSVRERLSGGPEWKVISRRIAVNRLQCVVHFTPAEMVWVSSRDLTNMSISINADHKFNKAKASEIFKDCPKLKDATVDGTLSFDADGDDDQFLIDPSSAVIQEIQYDIPQAVTSYFMNTGDQRQIARILVQRLFDEWPQFINIGEVLSYGCHIENIESIQTKENETKRRIAASFELKLSQLGFNSSIESEVGEKITKQLKLVYKSGISVSDSAAMYVRRSGDSVYVIIGKLSSCGKVDPNIPYEVPVEPYWYRMHWEGNGQSVVDYNQYKSIESAGITWNKSRGTIEIQCFNQEYDVVKSILSKHLKDAQVDIFMAHVLRAPIGQWKNIYRCKARSQREAH